MSTQVIFSLFFIVFAGIMVGAGILSKKWVSDTSDYILAGREISFPVNVMGVAAIGFAGTTVALAPGYGILYGFKGSILWGGIYAALGLILYGVLFSNFVRRCGGQTLPEYLEMRYSSKVRNVVAVGTIVGLCGILANNIASCAVIVAGFVGWPQWLVIAITFGIILVFTYISGVWAVNITDFIQVSAGILIVPTFLIMLVNKFGGLSFVQENWTGGSIWTTGITGMTMPMTALKYPSALTFVLLFGAALVWGSNYYWMKIASCRSEKIAKKSFVTAGVLLIIIFMIPLGIIGLYAGAIMPEVFTVGGGKVSPMGAYGVLSGLFNPVISSVFIIGSVAASISTASTSAIGATSTATRDIYQRMINPKADAKKTLHASKIIMLLIGLLTWALCYFPGGPTYLFAFANAWLVPPAVLLCFGAVWPKFNENGAFYGVLVGMITMSVLTITQLMGIFNVGKWTHLAIVGFLVTVIVGIIASYLKPSKYYAHSDWHHEVSKGKRVNVSATKIDKEVLGLIRIGHLYMADITDALGVDSTVSNSIIEKLDQGGLIERAGIVGSKFYEFSITDKGLALLAKLSDKEQQLSLISLTPVYVQLLRVAYKSPRKLGVFMKDQGWTSLKISSVMSHLTRQGYIVEKGLFKREVEITSKGIDAVAKFTGEAQYSSEGLQPATEV